MAETVKYVIEADISDFVRSMVGASASAEAADKKIRDSLNRTDRQASSTFGRLRKSFDTFDSSLDRSTDLVRDWNVAMRSVNTTTLVIGATSASGAVLGLAAAASQAVGVLYTLPGAILSVGGILATLRIGFGGIGQAVKALDKANVSAGGSAAALVKQLAGFDKMNILQDQSAGGAAGAAIADAMSKLSPAAQAVARALYEIGVSFRENIAKPVQEVLLNGVAPALLYTYSIIEGPLKTALINVAGALNLFILEALRIMTLPFFSDLILQVGELSAYIVSSLTPALEPLARGVASLFEVSIPFIQMFVDGLSEAIQNWGNWMASAEGKSAVTQSIEDSITALQVLGNLFGAVFGAIGAIFDVAGDAIYRPVNAITDLITRFEEWIRTAEGTDFVIDLMDLATNAIYAVGDALAFVGKAFAGVIDWFTGLSDSTQQTIIKFGIFIAALGGLVSYIGGLLAPVISFATAIASFVGPMLSAAGAAGGTATALGGLRVALGVLTGPVGWIITALTLLFTGSEEFRDSIGNLINSGLNLLVSVFGALMAILEPVMKIIGVLVDVVGGVLATVINALTPVIDAIVVAFDALMSILTPILDVIGILVDVIATGLKAQMEILGPIIEWLVNMAFAPLMQQLEFITPIFESLGESVRVVGEWVSTLTTNAMAMMDALGLSTTSTQDLDQATQDVKDAQDRYNESVETGIGLQEELKELEQTSVDAKLGVMDAQDRLKKKQDDYNEAIAKFGPNSREAERASLELESAQYKLDDAQTKVKNTGDDLKKKQFEVADQNKKTANDAQNLKDKNLALKSAQEGATGAAQGLKGALGEAIKGGVNGIIRMWNNFSIPPVVIMGKEVTPRINFPDIPYLARGGVVTAPTMAMIGEAGDEAVMPLENNTQWIDKLASKINNINGSGGQPIIVRVELDGTQLGEVLIDTINEKTQMSGRNAILV